MRNHTAAVADGSLGDMLLVRRTRLDLEKEAAAAAQAAHYGLPGGKAASASGGWGGAHTSSPLLYPIQTLRSVTLIR